MNELVELSKLSIEFHEKIRSLPAIVGDNLQLKFAEGADEKDGKQTFLEGVTADTARLSVHAKLLQDHPRDELLPFEAKRSAVIDASERISNYARIYQTVLGRDALCEKLIAQLNNVETVLNNISRPDDRHEGPR